MTRIAQILFVLIIAGCAPSNLEVGIPLLEGSLIHSTACLAEKSAKNCQRDLALTNETAKTVYNRIRKDDDICQFELYVLIDKIGHVSAGNAEPKTIKTAYENLKFCIKRGG